MEQNNEWDVIVRFLRIMILTGSVVFVGYEPLNLENNYVGIYFLMEETSYLKPMFDRCTEYSWLYQKRQVSEMPFKIVFNDEDALNYFIYFDKKEDPNIKSLIGRLEEERTMRIEAVTGGQL